MLPNMEARFSKKLRLSIFLIYLNADLCTNENDIVLRRLTSQCKMTTKSPYHFSRNRH